MKKIHLLLALLFGLATATMAQTKPQLTAVIKTPTVQCDQCKARIERYMAHEDGIVKINVDYKKKTTTVRSNTSQGLSATSLVPNHGVKNEP